MARQRDMVGYTAMRSLLSLCLSLSLLLEASSEVREKGMARRKNSAFLVSFFVNFVSVPHGRSIGSVDGVTKPVSYWI